MSTRCAARHGRDAARAQAKQSGVTLVAFLVDAAGKTVTVTVEKKAHTFLLQRMGFSKSWTVARTTRRRAVPE